METAYNMQPIADHMGGAIDKLRSLKSESFNRTVTMGERDDNLIKRLIRNAFDAIPAEEYWRWQEVDELIKTALNLGYSELAAQMTADNN